MSTTELREEIHKYIDQVDDRLVKLIHGMLKTDIEQEIIVGYTPDGKPITQEMYVSDIKEAQHQVKEGKVITQEELERLSENWQQKRSTK